jgi:hypothetical protein
MRGRRAKFGAAALAAAITAAALPLAAWADADPASDVLLSQRVFLPFFGGQASTDAQNVLKKAVDEANARGYTIKVAVIGSKEDLGGVAGAWGRPQAYASFLGQELRFAYDNNLLVAMPAGFGFYDGNRDIRVDRRAVAHVAVEPGTDGLVRSAARAVAALAQRSGVHVDAPSASGGGGGGSGRVVIAAAGGVFLVLLAGLPFALRAYRRRRHRSALS